ncbi:sulfate adenylyltransferase [Fictibacillus iocasae]|uniref:Sulfate adenylyltransferase n=1 Tax=Fictibacillus iocasae TaxID=2715437 RepID=A0ABW2NMH0_9BACL
MGHSPSTSFVIELDDTALADLYLISCGAYFPLVGFMNQSDYDAVLKSMHLKDGSVWSIPVVLPVLSEEANSIPIGSYVKLMQGDVEYGYMILQEFFVPDKAFEASSVYLTEDRAHPGVKKLFDRKEVYAAGPVWMSTRPASPFPYASFTPNEAREQFKQNGWKTIVGFQTRNPIHRAHEYIQKCAMETVDGLFLHPLVGETKSDDVPAAIRMESYDALLSRYYPPTRVLLGTFPASMRYAGPKEAVHHALVRRNYGCTHFIVGRDHAGVGDFYGTYDAQKIFASFTDNELGITPMFFDHSFYCKACGQMASIKTCPHEENDRMTLSGTKVREMLRQGIRPPGEFTRPEVADVLIQGMRENEGK